MTINFKDQLFQNFLIKSIREERLPVNILLRSNSCPFNSKESTGDDNFKNINPFLEWLRDNNLQPTLILSVTESVPKKQLKKLRAYEGGVEIVHASQKINYLLDFNIGFNNLKNNFSKKTKNASLGQLKIIEKKKSIDSEKDLEKFKKIISLFVDFFYNKSKRDHNKYKELLDRYNGFEFFPGYKKGCSANHYLHFDLKKKEFVFCPNYFGLPFSYGSLTKSKKIKSINSELMIAAIKCNLNNLPICETCPINEFCGLDCFLDQQKKTGDLFTPTPSFCKYQHKKLRIIHEKEKSLDIPNEKRDKLIKKIYD